MTSRLPTLLLPCSLDGMKTFLVNNGLSVESAGKNRLDIRSMPM
jgi:hypothetical protein